MKVASTLKQKLQIIRNLVKDELKKLSPLIKNLECGIGRLRSKKNKETMSRFNRNVQWLSQRCNGWMVKLSGRAGNSSQLT